MPPRFGGAPKCPRCEKSVYMAEQVLGPGGQWHNWCLTCKECNKRLDSTTLTEKDNEAYCKTCYTRKWGPKGYGFAGGAAFLSRENKMPSEILEENDLKSPTSQPGCQFNAPPPPPRQITPPRQEQQETTTTPPLPARQINTPALPPRQPTLQPRPQEPSKPEIPTRTNVVSPPPTTNHHIDDNQEEEQNMSSFWSNSNSNNKPKTTSSGYISHQTSYVPRKFNFQSQNDICTGCGKAVYAAELVLGAGNKYHKLCLKCCQCGKRLDSTNMVDKDFDLYCRGCYSKAFGPKGYGYGNLLTPEGATR